MTRATAFLLASALLVLPVSCAPPEPPPPRPKALVLEPGDKADLIKVDKSARRLDLYRGDELLKSYRVSLGPSPVGHKTQQGDGRTPEGRYVIDRRNPKSRYYKALHISYPNGADRKQAWARGVSPGGDILIHGIGFVRGGVTEEEARSDWTEGCIAVTNAEMDEIWGAVDNGTVIEIQP